MTWGVEALLILAAIGGAMAGLSALATRRIERLAPPQGGFLNVDGERLHVLDLGHGPPLVMIHGLSGQMGNFTHSLVPRLTGDFRVIAFDRPRTGYSTGAPEAKAGVEDQAAILAKAIQTLRLGKPLIVGHSLGGTVALALALNHPDSVGGLALIAPAVFSPGSVPKAFRALAIGPAWLRRLFCWTVATPFGLLVQSLTARAVFAPEPAPGDFGVAGGGLLPLRAPNLYESSMELAAAMTLGDGPRAMTRYASILVPIGVLYGKDDRVLDWRTQGEALKQMIPSLDLELAGGGHMLPITQPDVCAAFIRRIAARMAASAEFG